MHLVFPNKFKPNNKNGYFSMKSTHKHIMIFEYIYVNATKYVYYSNKVPPQLKIYA